MSHGALCKECNKGNGRLGITDHHSVTKGGFFMTVSILNRETYIVTQHPDKRGN